MSFPSIQQCRSKLTSDHADIVRATLPLIGANIESITRLFYKSLFEAHPELIKNLFNRGNQQQGAQQKALAASVALFASVLVHQEDSMPDHVLSRICNKHASLGVTKDQYQIVHDYLFGAIVQVLGTDTVTPHVAAAWEDVFWIMAHTLIDFEEQLYCKSGVNPGKVFVKTHVVERKDLSGGIASFSVESQDTSKPLPTHQPGQYISVRAHLPDGAGQLRQYSLVDAGMKPGRLSFAVKALTQTGNAPAGEVSNWLIENIHQGNVLEISLPFGDLVLHEQSATPVVLISSGIGVTPMLGILSRLAGEASKRPTLSLHADKSREVDPFADERVHLISQLDSGEAKTWYSDNKFYQEAFQGRMDLHSVKLPAEAEFYLCGGNDFLQAMRKQLEELHVPANRVYFELFSPNDWLLDN